MLPQVDVCDLLRTFSARHPEVEVELRRIDAAAPGRAPALGDLDAALVRDPAPDPALELVTVVEDRRVVAIAPTVGHLHRLAQIGGKYTLDQLFEHNWGNIVLSVTPRGFATPTLRAGEVTFVVDYALLDDRVTVVASTGTASLPLEAGTVAGFYARFVEAVAPLGLAPPRTTVAPEIPGAAPRRPADLPAQRHVRRGGVRRLRARGREEAARPASTRTSRRRRTGSRARSSASRARCSTRRRGSPSCPALGGWPADLVAPRHDGWHAAEHPVAAIAG